MFVKELIKRLKEFDPDESIRFYFLKNFDLKGCELEILDKLTENEICVGTLSDMIIRNFKRVEVNSEQRYKN